MSIDNRIVQEIPGLYKIIPLQVLRRTPGVLFDEIPVVPLNRIDAIDRVLHAKGADSPGPVGEIERPWYMHTHQDDHLLVLHGVRTVELYTPAHGRIESFEVSPEDLRGGDQVVCAGPVVLAWPVGVFHRIHSSDDLGSASLNFATHYEGFDIRTNFSIYDLDLQTGRYRVIREGHLDQPRM
jgi:hypothetical protein